MELPEKGLLVAQGSLEFAAGDDLTTEKKTSAISFTGRVKKDQKWLLAIEKATEDTAKDLTVKVYNVIKIDGTNARDVLHTTAVVDYESGAASYRDYEITGLFKGEGQIKLGMSFEADSGAITPKYSLYMI